MINTSNFSDSKPYCQRCGACCEKNSPALHHEDQRLIDNHTISLNQLITFRKGERVWDNFSSRLIALPQEIIKIKGQTPRWTCLFYQHKMKCCQIYSSRPWECQIQNCWHDPETYKQSYTQNRLTRADLIPSTSDIWAIIKDHDISCDYATLRQLSLENAQDDLTAKIRYDYHLRDVVAEKMHINKDELDFYFGRPLVVTFNTKKPIEK